MKILVLANNDVGLYKFRKELLENLVENNEVYICLPDGGFVSQLKAIGCKFIPCTLLDRHGTNPFKDIKLIMFYKKIFIEERCSANMNEILKQRSAPLRVTSLLPTRIINLKVFMLSLTTLRRPEQT